MLEKYTADLDNGERSREPIKMALPLQILNVIGWLCAILILILGSAGTFRYSFGTVWNLFATRLTPANYVAIIWFILFFFCFLFLIYQIFPKQRDNLVLFRDIHIFSFLCSLVFMAWVILYTHGNFWSSAAVCSLLVILLIVIYHRVRIGWKKATPPLEYICVHLFWSIFLAWMMCLCFENWAKAARHSIDWYGEGWNQNGWAVLLLCIMGVLTLMTLAIRRDWAFGLTVAWYMIAVGANQVGWRSTLITAYVIGAVLGVLSLLALALKIFLWLKERRRLGHGAVVPPPPAPLATGAPVTTTGITSSTPMPATVVTGRTIVEPPVVTRTVVEPPVMTRTEVVDPRSEVRREDVVP